jgi:stringent starvation protein B
MLSNKPYLIRAFYQWIMDSACTPFLVANANFPNCYVPREYVENGEITLNVSAVAVRDLQMNNELIEFRASFSGVVHLISIPVKAVLAIYAQENQQGMFFDYEEPAEEDETGGDGSSRQPAQKGKKTTKRKSFLKLVE